MQFTTNLSREEYDAFVASHPNSNLLQSYDWARVKSNWDHLYTGMKNEEGKLIATALVLIKPLPGGFSMMYIPRGPILDYTNQPLLTAFLRHLKQEGKKRRALFIKMDPAIIIGKYPSSDTSRPKNGQEALVKNFENAGCIHQGFTTMISESIQPRFHSIVDRPEDLLASLPKKTKKLIKEAEKRHLKIVQGRHALLEDFASLVAKTEDRKHVALRSKEYFKHLLDCYGDNSIIMLAIADIGLILSENQKKLAKIEADLTSLPENQKKKRFTLEEQKAGLEKDIANLEQFGKELGTLDPTPIAGVLTIKYGKCAEMLYAGMDDRFRRFMPQYKTYIENFQWAFDHGCEEFSMGGVEGTLDDGLTHFKDNFVPLIHEYIGEFDLPVNALLYKPSKWAYNRRKGGQD